MNLLSNALKFTQKGKIEINAKFVDSINKLTYKNFEKFNEII